MTYQKNLDRLGGVVPVSGHGFVSVSEEELGALEAKLGARIPALYRAFVRVHGAVTFEGTVMFPPMELLPEAISSTGMGNLSHFFGSSCTFSESLRE